MVLGGWEGAGSHDSIWQCSHHLRHQCQQRVWDKRRPSAAERDLLEKPTGQRRVRGVEIGRLFRFCLFYESPNYWCGWHRNGVWGQRDRIVDGPGQANLDLAISKTVMVNWPIEKSSVQFRAEFFNTLNHPQFANPDSNFTSPTFGVISSTAVNARVGQVALKFAF